MTLLQLDEMTIIATEALRAAGATETNAVLQAEVLVEAELRGHPSHGLLRLPRLVRRIRTGVLDPVTAGHLEWRGTAHLVVDGLNGFGPVVAVNALDALEGRVAECGVAVAAISRSNHLGMLAYYAERVACRGRALLALTTAEALVHPWGGRQAMLGTNPVAIGVPANPDPVVVDLATGVISMGKIYAHLATGQPLEPGWALDAAGDPTTNPAEATRGSIAPFGGAKGYALGIGIEVLVAALTGTALGRDVKGTLDDDHVSSKGDVFIMMDTAPDVVRPITAFLDDLRASPATDPDQGVSVPGDRSRIRRADSMRGGVRIDDRLWSEIRQLASSGRIGGHA